MQRSEPGIVQKLSDGLRGVIAPNAGPMTHWGTNTFLVGERQIAVIDPGPDDPAHLNAILRACEAGEITHIFVTHAHLDHSSLTRRLAAKTGAEVLAFGRADAGRTPVMQRLAACGLSGGGEGLDRDFSPHRVVREGDQVAGEGWRLEVLHTPGHFAGHLAFRWKDRLFSGDHVMDWSSSLVSPPDGSLGDFMATSQRLGALDVSTFHPAHGGALTDPSGRLEWLISHRSRRETEILDALGSGPRSIRRLTAQVYRELDPAMLPAAERNVLAHLIDLVEKGTVIAEPELGQNAKYKLA